MVAVAYVLTLRTLYGAIEVHPILLGNRILVHVMFQGREIIFNDITN